MTAVGSDAPAPLLTERLLLRPLTADDAGALLASAPTPPPRGTCRTVRSHRSRTAPGSSRRCPPRSSTAEWFHFGWAFELRTTGEVVGDGRTWNTEEPPAPGRIPAESASLGYVLHPEHHGLGLAGKRPAPWSSGFSPPAAARPFSRGVYEAQSSLRAGCWRAWASAHGPDACPAERESMPTPGPQRGACPAQGLGSPHSPACSPLPGHRTCPAHAPGTGHNALMPTPGRQE